MTNLQLFLIGVGVTLLLSAALAPLVWAAILDGPYNDQQQERYRKQASRAPSATGAAAVSGWRQGDVEVAEQRL